MSQLNLFAEENRLNYLSQLGDSLEKLRVVDWQMFRAPLQKALQKEKKGKGGRPVQYDCVMMFKIIVLQRLFNLSDDQTEFQINDRMTFMRFLGLGLEDKIPDAKTIWLFKDHLSKSNVMEEMFHLFTKQLDEQGMVTHTGTIVDATFVDVPRQRNTAEENKAIKAGNIPEEWQEDTSEAKHKLAQKDTDARWTKKNDETHYGYKDHAKVDAESKLITDYAVTEASVHDSQKCTEFLDDKDQVLYADSAYSGAPIAQALPENVENKICEKGYRDHPLTEEQKANNHEKSKIRIRIEHVFGFMTNSMHGISIRSIGMSRAKMHIGLMNLTYNMFRYAFLVGQNPPAQKAIARG